MMDQILNEKNTLYAPKFVEIWKEHSLYPLADWINGMTFRDFSFTSEGKPVVKIAEIKNGISKQTKFTNERYDEIYLLKKEDMLFCWSGQPETSIDVFWWQGPEGWLNQHTFKIIPKIENKLFFFYLLKYLKPNFIQIAVNKQTTGLGHVTKGDLQRFIVKLPIQEEQRAIATVLASFDDKVELLREQNKTLEATAHTIYKEWFVNFNFPGATGKMINTELDKIPEGWETIKLTELFDFVKGIEPGSNNYSVKKLSEDYLPFYRVKDTANYDEIPSIFVDQKILKGKIFKKDDILISLDGTIGRVFIGGSGGYSSGVRKVIGKEDFVSKFLIYCFLKSEKFQGKLNSFAGAETTIKHAGGAIKYIKFVFAKSVCEKFGKVSDSLFQKLISNISQIQTLTLLRDTLLPKLMKGEIRIKERHNG